MCQMVMSQAADRYITLLLQFLENCKVVHLNNSESKLGRKTKTDAPFSNVDYLRPLSFQSVSSPLQSLQQRTWLIHWSLFVFFNHPKGRDNIIELFLYQPQ